MTNEKSYCDIRNAHVRQLRKLTELDLSQEAEEALQWAVSRLEGMPEEWVAVVDGLPVEPKAPQFKPGDRVMIPETGTHGTILSVGSERAQVQYDHGPIREPMLSLLRPEVRT